MSFGLFGVRTIEYLHAVLNNKAKGWRDDPTQHWGPEV